MEQGNNNGDGPEENGLIDQDTEPEASVDIPSISQPSQGAPSQRTASIEETENPKHDHGATTEDNTEISKPNQEASPVEKKARNKEKRRFKRKVPTRPSFMRVIRSPFKRVMHDLANAKWYRITIMFLSIYIFLLSINMVGGGFKSLGSGFTDDLLATISDPMSAFCIGLLATAIIQSSSATTSILVTLTAAGIMPVEMAIPAILGSNIGTAITSIIVSFGHITRKEEFSRAFGGSMVQYYFNIIAVIIILPIELSTHILQDTATVMQKAFVGMGGLKVASPAKLITEPIINATKNMVATITPDQIGVVLIIIGMVMLFVALKYIVKSMRSLMIGRYESLVNDTLFKGPMSSFLLALGFTCLVQSSSITTSLLVPLIGAGILSIKKILPYTIGANIGTTMTAMLAALAAGGAAGVTLAFVHLLFNVTGTAIIYGLKPLRKLPIYLAEKAGHWVAASRKGFFVMVFGQVIGVSYIFPIIYLLLAGVL